MLQSEDRLDTITIRNYSNSEHVAYLQGKIDALEQVWGNSDKGLKGRPLHHRIKRWSMLRDEIIRLKTKLIEVERGLNGGV